MIETNSFKSRQLSAAQYVLALHEPDDRVAILVRNRTRRQTMQRILSAEEISAPPFQDWLRKENDGGADIFLGMNPLRANSFARTKESVREVRHVYLDLDQDAAASLRAIRTDGNTPLPNFVLDTSPDKNQVVWRVADLDRDQAESLLHSLAAHFNGDIAATDISRVLRMPGFANRKYNDRFLVRALQESDAIYHLRDFAIYEDSPEAPHRLARSSRAAAPNTPRTPKPVRGRLGLRQASPRPRRPTRGNHSAHRRLSRGRQERSGVLRPAHRHEGPSCLVSRNPPGGDKRFTTKS